MNITKLFDAYTPPIDYKKPLPDLTQGNKPLCTAENLSEVIRRLGYTVRYNVISKCVEILIPEMKFSIDNKFNASIATLRSECAKFQLPKDAVDEFLLLYADKNQFNPVATWIEKEPWDGVSRLEDFYQTITSNDEDFKRILMLRWMVSAIAAVYLPDGVAAQGVLVLQGDQNLGKTRWLKSLAPAHLEVIKEAAILNPADKDSVRECISFWLVELGELDATFRKADIAQLKGFLTKSSDMLRVPYAKAASQFARRTVFFGSVNAHEFLHDSTGNRRFWTIAVSKVNPEHGIDMQQLWAEVKVLYDQGERYHLTDHEIAKLNSSNKMHEEEDTWLETIRKYVTKREAEIFRDERDGVRDVERIRTTTILTDALHVEEGRQNRASQMRVANCLKSLGFVGKDKSGRIGYRHWVRATPTPSGDIR